MNVVALGSRAAIHAAAGGFAALCLWQAAMASAATTRPMWRWQPQKPAPSEEVRIKLAEAPEAVRSTALKMIPERSITKVIREADDGIVTYEIEFVEGDAANSMTFSGVGDVLEIERVVPQDKIPVAAREAVRRAYPGASLARASLVTKTYYEMDIIESGRKREIKVNAAGDLETPSPPERLGIDNPK